MINRKTVFILGAGASRDLGFPVGSELVSKIIEDLGNENSELYEHVVSLVGSSRDVKDFHKAIKSAPPPTIDLFLKDKSDDITRIGKLCIAEILIPFENPDKLQSIPLEHWYIHLFHKMYATTPEEFKNNKITFLTFNYDRSLEQFFLNVIPGLLGFSYKEAEEQFTDLVKIIHIYGQLGDILPGQPNWWREYSDKANKGIVYQCTESIKLMHEADDVDLRHVRQLIQEAQVVCFLGFGYHTSNLDKLFSGIDWPVFRASVYGSAKNIDEGYRGEIYDYFTHPLKKVNATKIRTESRIKGLGGKDDKILDFFNKNSVLTDKDN